MENSATKDFFTPDLYLTAGLILLLDSQPEFKVVNGKVLFGFPISDSLYQAMTEFNSGAPINALEYAQTLKRLKAEMFMRRTMGKTGVYHAG